MSFSSDRLAFSSILGTKSVYELFLLVYLEEHKFVFINVLLCMAHVSYMTVYAKKIAVINNTLLEFYSLIFILNMKSPMSSGVSPKTKM